MCWPADVHRVSYAIRLKALSTDGLWTKVGRHVYAPLFPHLPHHATHIHPKCGDQLAVPPLKRGLQGLGGPHVKWLLLVCRVKGRGAFTRTAHEPCLVFPVLSAAFFPPYPPLFSPLFLTFALCRGRKRKERVEHPSGMTGSTTKRYLPASFPGNRSVVLFLAMAMTHMKLFMCS